MTKKKIQLLRKLINGHKDFSFEEKIIVDNILINFTVSQLQIILYFLESKKKKKKKVEKDTSDDIYYDYDKMEKLNRKEIQALHRGNNEGFLNNPYSEV